MLGTLRKPSSRAWRQAFPWLRLAAFTLVSLGLACSEQPVGPDRSETALLPAKGGPPVKCEAGTNLSITLGDAAGDALQSDGQGPYVEGVDNVGAHINDPTGRLMLWPSQGGSTSRFVNVTSSENGGTTFQTTDRIYTNGHDTGDGAEDACGLIDIAPSGAGTAVLEAELDADGIVRYGKDCTGDPVEISGVNERVDITRSADGLSWAITGASGVHCRSNGLKGRRAGFVEVGGVGAFSMTLETIS